MAAMLTLSLPPLPPLNSLSISSSIRSHPYFIHGYGTPLNLSFKSLIHPANGPFPRIRPNSSSPANAINEQEQEEEEDYIVLTATRSQYNNIVILESESSKVLLLDDSGNVHSILYKGKKWTNSYWDEFSSLPAIIPKGPVAIFGLGGGTVAHQLLDFWPSLIIDGWELDDVLVDRARQFFGLSDLEKANEFGGVLRVCVGDALSLTAGVEGGYAGIVIDLFADAKVLPQLEKAEIWAEIREKLMPNGRIMVNCGGVSEGCHQNGIGRGWDVNLVIEAIRRTFGGQLVNWKKMPENESGNYMAFTGPLPDLDVWSASVPNKLRSSVKLWTPYPEYLDRHIVHKQGRAISRMKYSDLPGTTFVGIYVWVGGTVKF